MAGKEDSTATPTAETKVADSTVAVVETPKPWYLDKEINWDNPTQDQLDAALARAGQVDGVFVPKRTMGEVLSDHFPEQTEETQTATEETPAEQIETPAEETHSEVTEPETAPAVAEPSELENLRTQLAEAQAKLATIEAVKEQTQTKAERDSALAEMVETLGEDHPNVKAQKINNRQMDAFEARIEAAEAKAQERVVAAERKSEAAFHQFQLKTNKILGHVMSGKELDPNASPEAALVAYYNQKRLKEADEGKLSRTREEHYKLVEDDMKAARPDLSEKFYGKQTPKSEPKVQAKATVKKAPSGIQTMTDLKGGAVEKPVQAKGITQINPMAMSNQDFDKLFNTITR